MPHRCVAGGCSNTAKNNVSLHGWPSSPYFSRLWTNAVKNTRANFVLTKSSKLCSDHFSENAYEPQSVIANALGVDMKKMLKADAAPTAFTCPKKKQSGSAVSVEESILCGFQFHSSSHSEKQPRGAFRKREAARVCVI